MGENKITNFFNKSGQSYSKDQCDPDVSSSDESVKLSELEADALNYEDILNKKAELKKKTTIVLNKRTAGGSPVWNHFGQMVINNKHVLQKYFVCKMCFEATPTRIKGFGVCTSTSNLSQHLRNFHGINIKSKTTELSCKKTKSILFGNNNLLNKSETHKYANARLLVQMCCKDLRPFNIVEQAGFINYMQAIKPNIQMPSATTLSRSALNDVYVTYENTIKEYIIKKSPKNVSLVLDMWTDSFKRRSYINIRAIFCDQFQPIYITLKTEIFPHPHNKYTISQNICNTLRNFKLDKKEIVVISDGASNIIAAMNLVNMKRLGCSSHSLHRLIVHDILQNREFGVFHGIVNKLKHIFKCLNYNTEIVLKIQSAFEDDIVFSTLNDVTELYNVIETEEQFKLYDDQHDDIDCDLAKKSMGTLKNSNDTRWNTLCYMFRSFSTNEKVVNIALVEIGKTELALNKMEKLLLAEFLKFLEIFENATKHLQGRKYPTISCNIVFHEHILDCLTENYKTASFEESINIYNYSIIAFAKRLKICKIHVVAALLDPIQKNWQRIDKWLKKIPAKHKFDLYEELKDDDPDGGITRTELILKEIQEMYDNGDVLNMPTSSYMAKRKKQDKNTFNWTIASFVSATSNNEEDDPLKLEVLKYFAMTDHDTDTYNFWKKNEKEFPQTAKLAAYILSIPSTSASAEEAFSSAGSLVTAKRSNLNPLTVKQVLFVHDNYDLVNDILKK